jgi:hypothetical protein
MIAALALLFALTAPAGAGSEPDAQMPAELLWGGLDEVVRAAFIPSARNVHGEFRLLRRDGATCAQTLLYTTSLRRAVQRIRKKERRYWPAGVAGSEDSAAYLEALDRAKDRVLAGAGEADGIRRQTLAIEFVLAPDVAFYALYELDVRKEGERIEIAEMRPIEVREASADYVAHAMELMEQAAFDRAAPEEEAEEDQP